MFLEKPEGLNIKSSVVLWFSCRKHFAIQNFILSMQHSRKGCVMGGGGGGGGGTAGCLDSNCKRHLHFLPIDISGSM